MCFNAELMLKLKKFNEKYGCDTLQWSVKIDHVIVTLPRAKSE